MRISGMIGAVIVGIVILGAALSLVWTPYDPVHAIPADRLQSSSLSHVLGTDRYGRDIFSQILAGSRVTLLVGLIAVGIGVGLGTPMGIIAGMKRGMIDQLIMRGADMLLAFPALLMAIVAGAIFGASTVSAMVAIGIAAAPSFARVARAGTMQVMSRDYIAAARLSGRSPIPHILPNIAGMLTVQASVAFALAILAEAALSFLGLGTPPPDPSWGRMLQSAQASLGSAPMLAVWPGITIAITVLGFNLLGDGLRDLIDPKTRRAA